MGMQKIEFEFPDPDSVGEEIEVEGSSAEPVLDADKQRKADKEQKKQEQEKEATTKKVADDLEVEIVDDTPEEDRGRKPSKPPEDITDDELAEYSEKVQKRIKRFTKGYHDERRAKEAAMREKMELENLARRLHEENKRLQGTVGTSRTAMLEHAKRSVANDLEQAKKEYKAAYEAGDADAVLTAQEKLTTARFRTEQLNNIDDRALQAREAPVQQESTQDNESPQAQQPRGPDARALAWRDQNTWFGQPGKDSMTAFALGYHNELVESHGVDPTSDEYYEKLDSRMRQVFPDEFEDADEDPRENARRKTSVVAPATRSTAPKKVKLTQTQVAIAKRLGVPLEEYARQVAIEMRNANG